MANQNVTRVAFNRGKVSPLALARTDIERVELSAQEQTNFVPRVLGSMMLRPGWKYLGSTLSDSQAFLIPFVKSTDDTAFVEFTNESMRVWEDDTPIERNAVSTLIRGGDFSADITNFLKITDPTTAPTGNGNDVAFSPDGQLMAVAHDTTPFLTVYYNSGTGSTPAWTSLSTPASVPSTALAGVAFSPAGNKMAIAYEFGGAGFSRAWSIAGTGASAVFTLISSPANPEGPARACAFSPDGQFYAIAHATTPFVSIYTVNASSFTEITAPSSLPAGDANGLRFSHDSRFLTVAHDTTPFITIYEINGTTFTKLSDPSSLPAGAGQDVTFSRDGTWMAVAHTTTPFVTIYAVSGTTFTKATNPGTLPDGNGRGVAFSSDDQFLAVVHATSLFLSHYRNVAGVWTKQTDPATPPDGIGNRVAFSPNNLTMAVAHDTSTYLTLYQAYQWLDMDGSGAASSYPSSSTFVDTFNPTLTTVDAGATSDGSTVRQVIEDTQFTRYGGKVKITFKAAAHADGFVIDSCYIGQQGSGDDYDFASAPTQITFNGGSAGFTLGTGASITSDEIVFAIASGVDYVIAWHCVGTGRRMANAASASGQLTTYYKAGSDASTVNATGYSLAGLDVLGIDLIQVYETTTTANTGLTMVGTNYIDARRIQAVSVTNTDKVVEHGIRVIISQGLINFQVGTEYNTDDLVTKRTLGPGVYSFAFTPNENLFFVDVSAKNKYSSILSSIQIDGGGDLTIPTPYTTDDLQYIRHTQSGDIIYVACTGVKQQKLLRFGSHSWGVADYLPEDGPFRGENTDFTTLTASALTGDITITASKPYFKATMDNTLFRISSVGQATQDSFTAQNQFGAAIKVTGTGTSRDVTVTRSGTWSATVTLQRSVGEPGTWVDVATFTTNGTATYNDGLDNQIIYYRIGIKTGNYTSGTAVISLSYAAGSKDGIARVTSVVSSTVVNAIVLSPMGGTTAFETWAEGIWSDYRGWPSAVTLYEGRLCWAGMDRIILSKSDAYESFDDLVEGDSGPIIRSIGEGPVDDIHWLLPLQRLLAGAEGSELSIRSNSFDEPLTPDNYNMKAASTQGSAPVAAVRIDTNGAFVERSATRLYQLVYNFDTYDYASSDLTRLVPDTCSAGIRKLVLQRHPDTRLHCILNDGTVAMLVFEQNEQVICWVDVETDGEIEDAVVLPQQELEDAVYYVVRRTINGLTKRYVEKWALETECVGGTLNKQADSFIEYSGVSTAAITGLDHLEGETVVVWGNGIYLDTYTVTGGAITLSQAVTSAIIGLSYNATYKSTKLAYAAEGGSALNKRKRVKQIGLIMANTHARGLQLGDSYDFLRYLPTVENNQAVSDDYVWTEYDFDMNAYNTNWSTDSRVCLKAIAPLPVTVLAFVFELETHG